MRGRSQVKSEHACDKPEDNVIREKMWVSRAKNSHLSQSKKTPGEHSPLTRDDESNQLGQVTLSPIEDEDDDWDEPAVVYVETPPPPKSAAQEALEQLIQEVAGHLVDRAIAAGEFRVRKFYNEKALPMFQAKWEQRPRLRRTSRELSSAAPTVAEVRVVVAEEIEEATAEYRQNMSSNEAQARLVMAILLRAMSDAQLEMVANADIDLDVGSSELERRLAGLPTEQVTHMIETLVADPSSLENQLLDIEKLFGPALPDGERRPNQK